VPADLGQGIVTDATRSFRDYFYVLTLSSLPVAVIVALTAVFLGVPLAFTIGLVTFVTSYVPYLGALVSSVFALLIAFGSGGPVAAIVMLVVILVAQNVVQPIIQRQLERNALDLHPIVSFGSTIVGSVLIGVLGATLSAPTVAMVLRVRQRIEAFQAGELDAAEIDALTDDDPATLPAS
jgi:predicted PurR-regulated permease PerM